MNDSAAETLAIEVRDLTKRFGHFTAVDNLNIQIERGEIYGLLGPNGAGKTTSVKMMAGLLKPTAGEIFVVGKKQPDKGIPPQIGYMPQETALYLELTAHQNIKFFGRVYGLSREVAQERERALLEFVELEKWRDTVVSRLSGGMKHRVSLACSMVHQPSLLMLDEPTVGVDPDLRASFWERFRKLKDDGTTILITTHYIEEATHCDRVGLMRKGRLIAEDTPDGILESTGASSLEDAFLRLTREQEGAQ